MMKLRIGDILFATSSFNTVVSTQSTKPLEDIVPEGTLVSFTGTAPAKGPHHPNNQDENFQIIGAADGFADAQKFAKANMNATFSLNPGIRDLCLAVI